MFNAGLREFITGQSPSSAYGTIYQPNTKDNVLTLPEMLGIDRKAKTMTTTTGTSVRVGGAVVSPASKPRPSRTT